jgi:hypothetical protein
MAESCNKVRTRLQKLRKNSVRPVSLKRLGFSGCKLSTKLPQRLFIDLQALGIGQDVRVLAQ